MCASEIGADFQAGTKYQRDCMDRTGLDWSAKPPTYKRYPDSQITELPAVRHLDQMPLHDAISRRKSVRRYQGDGISAETLSYLLWASTGVSRRERNYEFRTAPSAGALYPIETYVVVNQVEGIEAGLYHYAVNGHELELLRAGDWAVETAQAALDQKMCAQAPVVLIWTAVFPRTKWKYRQRAYRYVYLDAGHIAAHVALVATALGLGSCQIAAFYDDEANDLVEVDGIDESVIYMSVVG